MARICVVIPKILCGFWAKLGSFGHSCKNPFFQKLNVRNEDNNHRILKLLYWTSKSKKFNPSFHENYKIIIIKDQSFFGSFSIVKFFTPKFTKVRCYLRIFVTFESGFQIKLTIYGSSLSLRCISISELKYV